MKKAVNGFLTLTIVLTVSLGTLTACGASEMSANDKAAAEQPKSPAETEKVAKNKAAETAPTKSIEVFDGRNAKFDDEKLTDVDLALVETDVRKKAKEDFLKNQIVGADFNWKEEFKILAVAEGSFTQPNSTGQRAVLYRFSYTNGVVILSDGDIVAHYSGGPGDYAFYTAIKSLPDVNKNGMSEIVLLRNVEDNEDIIAYLFEAKDGKMKFVGEAGYFGSDYAAGDDTNREKARQTAYRVTVEPAANPIYLRETYQRANSKDGWKLTKKAEKFSWRTRDDDVYDLTRID